MQCSPMDNFTADRLIAAHDGDVALLYIYLLRTGSENPEDAARDLCRTLREVSAAWEKLQRMGLLPDAAAQEAAHRPEPVGEPSSPRQEPAGQAFSRRPEPAEELPEYETEDLVRRSKEDAGFAAVVQEAQKVLGHVLSSSDLKRLFGIYDYLALPPEVILMLLNHCVTTSKNRRPSMRYIEKEAYVWANREILSLDQAEEYIRRSRERQADIGRVKEALNIRGRELTATEAKYIGSWLDMGFGEDCLSIAYDRTVTNTGALKWGYMNKILLSWHEKGIHTPEEVQEKDGRRKSAAPAKAGDKPIDMDKLRAIVEQM